MQKTKATILILILTACLLLVNGTQAARRQGRKQPDYLTIVEAYANAMIKDGRDVYGTKHSPLFASALDRRTMRLGDFQDIDGVRNGDRSLGGANPQEDRDLYAILYRLTDLCGEKQYANEADKALEFFFSHCQSPVTGLMTWGEHLHWDFAREEMGGNDLCHEIKGEWPFWNECYKFTRQACWKFAIGQWDHQIADKKTGDFSRHAKWSSHGPNTGADFPRYAGQMIANWTDAYVRKENRGMARRSELVTAISTLVSRMEGNMKTPTGYLLAGTDKSHGQISWPTHNLELARCLWNCAPHMEGELAERMKKLALRQDLDFHRMPHTISDGGGFVATIDVISGLPRSRSMNRPYTTTWTTNYGQGTHAGRANRCFSRFEQIEESHKELAEKYKLLILSAANQYLTATPDTNDLLKPETIAHAITLMLNSHSITGKEEYLDRANYFGHLGIKLFLDDGLPLPRATNQHDHYESITGGPCLMHTLLKLHEALDNVLKLTETEECRTVCSVHQRKMP